MQYRSAKRQALAFLQDVYAHSPKKPRKMSGTCGGPLPLQPGKATPTLSGLGWPVRAVKSPKQPARMRAARHTLCRLSASEKKESEREREREGEKHRDSASSLNVQSKIKLEGAKTD